MSEISARHDLFALIQTLANRLQSVGDAAFSELTRTQVFLLLAVSVFETPPSISDVASLIGTTHQNTKQILLKIERAGFVTLVKDPCDQRRTLIEKTALEESFSKKHAAMSNQFINEWFAGISTDELAVTRSALHRVEHNLKSFADRQKIIKP